jgi:hypothetical protein
MEINNIFDYCVDDLTCNDAFYFIDVEHYGNTCINMAFNREGKLLKYANDWLHLITGFYNELISGHSHIYNYTYHIIKDTYNKIMEISNEIFINEDIIPLISSFSVGTGHGYAGLFDMLFEYITNYDKYKNFKIIVYLKSQAGILEIIEYLCESGVIDRQKLIFIDSGIKYRFKSINLIKVNTHIFMPNDIKTSQISNFINETWVGNSKFTNNRLCLLKTTGSVNITNSALVNKDVVNIFCNKYNFINCSPGINFNENELIFQMKNCEIFITNWGTSYIKNYYYLSEKCKYIIVFYDKSYFDAGVYPHKNTIWAEWCPNYYKNAKILYQVIDQDILLNPEIENALN